MLKGVFLPTPSHGGRHFNTVYIGSLSNFYPRPHMEGDNIVCFPFPYACLFLPTPSHGGRPCCKACMYNVSRISTHALTWRATMVKNIRQQYLSNFYPRPHMEGDQRERKSAIIKTGDFYPRPHMEGDGKKLCRIDLESISTHALTWRATLDNSRPHPHSRFLPTPSHGGRPDILSADSSTSLFLPTPSHGGRLCFSISSNE